MIKVVIDTSVLISSFWGGEARKVIDLWKSGRIVLCLTKEIIDEYTAVLKHLGVGKEELKDLYNLIISSYNILYSVRSSKLHAVSHDPGDDKFIECAFVSNAEYIISIDKDLLNITDYFETRVVTPRKFLDSIKAKA